MMPSMNAQQHSAMNINQLQTTAMNVVYNFCSIVTMPVEMALRPRYGTRYFSPVALFFASAMMIVLPLFSSFAASVGRMVPFARVQASIGLLGMWGLAKLFFLGAFVHGLRSWRRMLNMDREENSYWEGPPLFFFRWLPKATFWKIRIIYEPLFVLALSAALPNFFIVEGSVGSYLAFAAFMLAMKQYVAWYQQWEFLRDLFDSRAASPLIAKIVENRATDDDLATMHMASFPKNLPDDLRKQAAAHIARVFSVDEQASAAH